MLNYSNLNDVEFEELCKDIMSKKLNTQLRSFAAGKDGGIDLADNSDENNIIVQVKHYIKSDVSVLINSLKNELSKLDELKPNQYYICCAKELSPAKIKEIYQMFNKYMSSSGNIITLKEIDDFLTSTENIDILRKHYKLWISSTNILDDIYSNDIFIDSEVLLAEINNEFKYFVETEIYNFAKEAIKVNNVICLVGDPGVGKTTTSKMLVLYYASLGYRVRYTTTVADLNSLKKSLSKNKEAKEIILLDDCFGQAYFEMKNSQASELVSLIKYINICKNKILILNSRITIYREANVKSQQLAKSLENNEYKVSVINTNQISAYNRARILYNHLYFNELPTEYFQIIKNNKNYYRIINHTNYNPRIIEFVTNKNIIRKVKAENYLEFIFTNLDNPTEVWDDEYKNKLQPIDRVLISTIYSLTDTYIQYEYAKEIFEQRLENISKFDETIDNFETSLMRLQSSFFKIISIREQKMISVANPSINDYLDIKRKNSDLEYRNIIKNSKSIYQLKRLLSDDEFNAKIIELFDSTEIINFIFPDNIDKITYISEFVMEKNIENIEYKEYLFLYLDSVSFVEENRYMLYKNAYLLLRACEKEFYMYYGLSEFFNTWEKFSNILYRLDVFETMEIVTKIYDSLDKDDDFVDDITDLIHSKICSYCEDIDCYEYEDPGVNYEAIANNTYEDYIDKDSIIDEIEEYVTEKVQDKLNEYINLLPVNLNKIYITEALDMITIEYISDMVESYIEEDDVYYEGYDEMYRKKSVENKPPDQIDLIFK